MPFPYPGRRENDQTRKGYPYWDHAPGRPTPTSWSASALNPSDVATEAGASRILVHAEAHS